LNFGSPERPDIMWQFAEAVRGMADACRALGTPVTGGNVSFYNETLGTPIFPTPIVGMVGLLEDYSQACTQWFKTEGDIVFLLGETLEELGASEYLKVVHNREVGRPPRLDLPRERGLQQACLEAIRDAIACSAHDCADGGLAVALAECCLAPRSVGLGADLRLPGDLRADALLFGESASRIVLSVRPEHAKRVCAIARRHGVPCTELGTVGGDRLTLDGRTFRLSLPVERIHWAWSTGLSRSVK
jgi:phosphoribosylformylglycinamidine synthase